MQLDCIYMRSLVVAAVGLSAGCSGETGTIDVSLTTAPGSMLLDSVQSLRMTVTNPRQVVTAERSGGGFALALELEATGEATAVLVEGFDAGGALVASGGSPRFPAGAINGRIVIYMAPPLSVGVAPKPFDAGRTELGAAPLPYGVIFAGGRVASGAPSDVVAVYNAFDHSLIAGMGLPAARASMAIAIGSGNAAYMFGGTDDAGAATASLWRFDTTAPPAGSYLAFGDKDGFARAGEQMVPLGGDRFVITGMPAASLSGLNGMMAAVDDVAELPPSGVTVAGNDGMLASIFAGAAGVVRLRNGTYAPLAIANAARAGASVVALPGGKVLVACGSTEAVRIDVASGMAESFSGVPVTAKTGCAVAATPRHLIIAGGDAGGTVDGRADIFDAATLAPLATVVLAVPRKDATAIALPNDQVLIAGGVDTTGAPVATLELFTPPVE
jgi:hypothetical protein